MADWNVWHDAAYIREFAERMKEQWGNQSKDLDVPAAEAYLQTGSIDVAVPKDWDGRKVIALNTGEGGRAVDERAALLNVVPFVHVNVPSEEQKDKEHGDKLEAWLNAGMGLSQAGGKAWNRQTFDLPLFGRGWTKVYPVPSEWAGDEVQGLLATHRPHVVNLAEGEEPTCDCLKEIKAIRRDAWPIRWRYCDPRNAWSYFSDEMWLPESLEIRTLTPKEARNAYPKASIAENATTEIEVYDYGNHAWNLVCLAVPGGEVELVHEYEHHLGKSPYVLLEAGLMPPNDRGWRWKSSLKHVLGVLQAMNTIFSDLTTNHRLNTLTPRLFLVSRQDHPEVAGQPKQIEMEPGGDYTAWDTTKPQLVPVPQMGEQSLFLLRNLQDTVREAGNPVLRGESKSGQSQNQFVTALQVAERAFDPSMRAIEEAYKYAAQLHLRAVLSLNRRFPEFPDEVTAFHATRRGMISVGPKDVRGWENALQARASRAIPIDRNLLIAQAQGLQGLGVPPDQILEELGYENPHQMIRMSKRARLVEAAFEQQVEQVAARANVILQRATPEEIAEMNELMASASPALAQFLTQTLASQGAASPAPETPGNVRQALSNIRRAATPQEPGAPPGMALPQEMM